MSTLRAKQRKALMYGASNLQPSNRKHKKYFVTYGGKDIHFGDSRYEDYTQHGDKIRRESYLKRAMGIRNKHGCLTFRDKMSPNYWAIRILW